MSTNLWGWGRTGGRDRCGRLDILSDRESVERSVERGIKLVVTLVSSGERTRVLVLFVPISEPVPLAGRYNAVLSVASPPYNGWDGISYCKHVGGEPFLGYGLLHHLFSRYRQPQTCVQKTDRSKTHTRTTLQTAHYGKYRSEETRDGVRPSTVHNACHR